MNFIEEFACRSGAKSLFIRIKLVHYARGKITMRQSKRILDTMAHEIPKFHEERPISFNNNEKSSQPEEYQ